MNVINIAKFDNYILIIAFFIATLIERIAKGTYEWPNINNSNSLVIIDGGGTYFLYH
jgi:hypothetical protein